VLAAPAALAVGRIWQAREQIELEAAALFDELAAQLSAIGAHQELVAMARQAADDERAHAVLCREIIDRVQPDRAPLPAPPAAPLGPAELDARQRALYSAVAISCVTETLSAALLLAMRERATPPWIRGIVYQILRDEISHSRLGWALLAAERQRAGADALGWLAPHLDAMLADAVVSDVEPMTEAQRDAERPDYSEYGILRREEVGDIVREAIEEVIVPGLREHGIDAGAALCFAVRYETSAGRSTTLAG